MTHLFTITFDHYRQFLDAFRLSFSSIKAIQPVNYREHPDHKINTDIHPAIITELIDKQYRQIDYVTEHRHKRPRPGFKVLYSFDTAIQVTWLTRSNLLFVDYPVVMLEWLHRRARTHMATDTGSGR